MNVFRSYLSCFVPHLPHHSVSPHPESLRTSHAPQRCVQREDIKDKVATPNTKARVPQERVLLERMCEIKQEHDSVIADEWLNVLFANDSYMSFTSSYIGDA